MDKVKKSKVTIRDVAREAGVSVATVSRYLNNTSYISTETEKKLKEVMHRLDYKPNEIARGLAKQKTNTIALIIPDITNPFFPDLVIAIEQVAKEKGYNIILVNTQEEELQSNSFWRGFQNRYVDGFILASFQFDQQALKDLEALQIPFVRIDRAAFTESSNSIGIDNYKGAIMAVEHLKEIGCRKIAHISGPQSLLPSIERMRGFEDHLRAVYSGLEPIIYEGDFTLESGRTLTDQLIGEHKDVDGIFFANDLMAVGAIKALKALRIKVPDDVAIIGFDGIKLTEMIEPEISTIVQPIYDIGVTATTKLIHLIENKVDETLNHELEVQLVKRESTLGFRRNSNE
ncbi:LacI family DNA-binding transcriptional regulator [Bacillus horti]|uniref:LacI family transcriptional regulator n=1 Tax=Caldalkalibacillus horti TaxID=77523 RepID=A0ABT9W356_9BACI|nr:LacI family DNA-binding transcriptional regulator [Bacillus horti]MDQ0167671.1 LacI family transcriptional regulator [Bacillus horti]